MASLLAKLGSSLIGGLLPKAISGVGNFLGKMFVPKVATSAGKLAGKYFGQKGANFASSLVNQGAGALGRFGQRYINKKIGAGPIPIKGSRDAQRVFNPRGRKEPTGPFMPANDSAIYGEFARPNRKIATQNKKITGKANNLINMRDSNDFQGRFGSVRNLLNG